MIKGITATLYERKKTGEDPFGNPVYEEHPDEVENVLVATAYTTAEPDTLNLTG